jgi:hypothetical protein
MGMPAQHSFSLMFLLSFGDACWRPEQPQRIKVASSQMPNKN